MPPIKVHIDDPITPKREQASTKPTPDNANTTQESLSPYPDARPGAAAVPAPTPYAPSPQAQPTPTRTTTSLNYGPPPPQPGQVPVPFRQQAPQTSTIPPPPKAGETPSRQGSVTTMPPQMNVPSPQQNHTPTQGTMTSPHERTARGPTTLNFGAVPAPQQIQADLHPPGYQQNTYAQELTPAARLSLDNTNERESKGSVILGDGANDTANSVSEWTSAAGNALKNAHDQVWKSDVWRKFTKE